MKKLLLLIAVIGLTVGCVRVEIEEECYYEDVFIGYDQYDRAIYENKLVCYFY